MFKTSPYTPEFSPDPLHNKTFCFFRQDSLSSQFCKQRKWSTIFKAFMAFFIIIIIIYSYFICEFFRTLYIFVVDLILIVIRCWKHWLLALKPEGQHDR